MKPSASLSDQSNLSMLRVCDRELDRDRHQSLPAEKGDPRGVVNWKVPPKPRKGSSGRQINWNPWILTCMLVITIALLTLVEVHIQRVTIHPPFLQ